MATLIAEISIILVFLGLLGGCIWGACQMFREREWGLMGLAAMGALVLIAICAGLVAEGEEDSKNPCIAWGTPQTIYVMMNNILTPITTTPCIQRQNTTIK